MFSIKEIYDELIESYPTRPLLTNYSSTFWSDYVTNYATYDRLFLRRYFDFRYYYPDEDAEIDDVASDFYNQVQSWLKANDKKYSELYRIYTLSDSDNPLGNYKINETISKNIIQNGSQSYGQRQDSTSNTNGARTDTNEEQVAGFNSSAYSNANKNTLNKGAETDTSSFTKGSQSDSSTLSSSDSTTRTKTGYFNKSSDNLVEEHLKTWGAYEFYTMIFMDISRELLLV